MMSLLVGNPSPDTLEMVATIASLSPSECIAELFSNPNNVKDLFSSLGNFVDLTPLKDALASLEENLFINPNVCASEEDIGNINEIRCFLLSKKSSTEKKNITYLVVYSVHRHSIFQIFRALLMCGKTMILNIDM